MISCQMFCCFVATDRVFYYYSDKLGTLCLVYFHTRHSTKAWLSRLLCSCLTFSNSQWLLINL